MNKLIRRKKRRVRECCEDDEDDVIRRSLKEAVIEFIFKLAGETLRERIARGLIAATVAAAATQAPTTTTVEPSNPPSVVKKDVLPVRPDQAGRE